MKYGIHASSGGGRASARETIGRVAAGSIAEKILYETFGIRVLAYVSSVGDIQAPINIEKETHLLNRDIIDKTPVRCPDPETSAKMEERRLCGRNCYLCV